MNIKEFKAIIKDLPDDMPVAFRSCGGAYDIESTEVGKANLMRKDDFDSLILCEYP